MSFPLPFPDLPWLALAAIPLIVLLAYTVFGATGFGSSLIGVPLLTTALLMVPLMILGLVIGNGLHHALSGSGFMRVVALLFLGNGISLLIRAVRALTP